MKFEVQLLTEKYIPAVIALADSCGLAKRDAAQLQEKIDSAGYIILVSLQSDKATGFIEAQMIADEIHLYDVAVDPKFRRQGIAQALIEELTLQPCTAILLEVRESNQAALQLYQKCGFAVDGSRKNYYSSPVENAVLMSRKIS